MVNQGIFADDHDNLVEWSSAEKRALGFARDAALSTSGFYDEATRFFWIGLPVDVEVTRPLRPNTATKIIGVVLGRNPDILSELKKADASLALQSQVAASREALRDAPPNRSLPLMNFGVLPEFSASHTAEALPECYGGDTKGLASSVAYRAAITKLISTLYPLSRFSARRITPHPYLLCHMSRALRAFQRAYWADRKAFSGFFKNLADLWTQFTDNELNNDDRLRLAWFDIYTGIQPAIDHGSADGLAAECLGIAEDLAQRAVLTEIHHATRDQSGMFDPAPLAWGLLTLSEADPSRYSELLHQGLNILLEGCSGGFFACNRPFFSDLRGRSLSVTSVETANAVLSMAVKSGLDFRDEMLARIEAVTAKSQRRLVTEEIRVALKDKREYQGWCSDRSASRDHIDSWVTAHVLEFFMLRVALLRHMKRRFVFSQFVSVPHSAVTPVWKKLIDPDLSHCNSKLKDKIENVVTTHNDGVAPVFLLYGPPGTSKTTIAKSAATIKKWDILLLSPSDFVKDGLDNIEYRSRLVFDRLMNIDRCVVVFDEIDTLFRNRQKLRDGAPSMLEFVVPALLPKLQDFRDYAMDKNLIIFFLTNFIEMIDPAISRSGRIDRSIVVLPYSKQSRQELARQFYEKALSKPENNQFASLRKLLAQMPCNLLFRDIEAIATFAAKNGVDEDKIVGLAKRRGVRPESYDVDGRDGAEAEAAMFFARLAGETINDSDLDGPDTLASLVKRSIRKMERRKSPLYKPWIRLAEQWQAKLDKFPT